MSLIQTEDPLDIFNYDIDDEELEELRDQLSFKLKNNSDQTWSNFRVSMVKRCIKKKI